MSYNVKEIYLTIQGEGVQAGRPAVFCRFSGCNLWSGHEKDRTTALCQFCDTDFVGTDGPGGGTFDCPEGLVKAIAERWPRNGHRGLPFVVFTGGEPLLQLGVPLVMELHRRGFEVAVETNGTRQVPEGIDWICVSPKTGANLLQRQGNELKLVFPQIGAEPERFEGLDFAHFLLQPMDGNDRERNTELAISYCLEHPHWRLSLQTHKFLGLR